MLGQPSLQYRFQRLLKALWYFLVSKIDNSWRVMKYRYRATRELYESQLDTTLSFKYSNNIFLQALDSAATAVNTIVAFILAMIATIIGVNLIGPVATAVGGALNNKNLTGAANSLTAQITLLFVVVVILGVVIFIAVLGKMASSQAD